MNHLDNKTLRQANLEAIYNIYLYLANKIAPQEDESLQSIVFGLEKAYRNQIPYRWDERDLYRLHVLKNAIRSNPYLAGSKIRNLTRSENGLTACSFTKPDGSISVVFRGTGSGEWIDNGEGLSGIPEKNTYITYTQNGMIAHRKTVTEDYATDQQVEALNWFNRIAARDGWNFLSVITVSGHSKGGNKAQFVAIHSSLVDECFSFDGQGFSPEALTALKNQYGEAYEERRKHIKSLSAANDYVNVLGERLMPETQIFYFASQAGIHNMEAILDANGKLLPQGEQGTLSAYVESVSDELMGITPSLRQYATLGIMNIFQKYLGKGVPVNGDSVSIEKTVTGIALAVRSMLRRLT